MVDNLKNAAVYTDFNGLAELRRMSRKGGEDAIRAVAKQFEALFTQMMLKSMRDTMPEDGIFSSSEMKTYMDMYDKQLSLHLSEKGGLGLSEMLVRQLSGKGVNANVQVRGEIGDYLNTSIPAQQVTRPKVAENHVTPTDEKIMAPQANREMAGSRIAQQEEIRKESTPEEFVRFLWGYAKDAAKKYGLNAKAIIAQAALETGWGKHIMRDKDGSSSNNLFGIKADYKWNGDKVHVSTLEYRDGTFRKEAASFRSYSNIAESIDDYARFISSRSRYSEIGKHVGNPEAYADHLQKAGYATDPNYADKIKKILRSGILENALSNTGI